MLSSESMIQALEDYLASQILTPQALTQYRTGDVAKSELRGYVESLAALSIAYTGHTVGCRLPSPIGSQRAAEAYALYYTTINAAKVLHLAPLLSLEGPAVSVLDVGCGPGTATLALLTLFERQFSITCCEAAPHMRALAEKLISNWRGRGTVSQLCIQNSHGAIKGQQFDIVIAAHVLAEMSESECCEMIDHLSTMTKPGGYLLLVEPGQLPHTRRLMSLRDHLALTHPELIVQFPCTRSDSCPMLATSTTDWCHGTIEWQQPRLNAQLDRLLHFNKHRIKFSSFLFQRHGVLRPGVRMITAPERTRAGTQALVCGRDLYGIVRVRKGTRSEGTRPFEKAAAYDRLMFSTPVLGDMPPGVSVQSQDT